MAAATGTRPARVGFRRDIKLFLAALIGYFIVFILLLIISLQNSLIDLQQSVLARREATADFAVERAVPEVSPEQLLAQLADRHGVIGVTIEALGVKRTAGETTESSASIRRIAPAGSLTIHFDDELLAGRARTFRLIAVITIGGTLLGTLLLLLYLQKIIAPIDAMIAHAEEVEVRAEGVDEAEYLVATFKSSLEQLRAQKLELERLHGLEKARADELERVTETLTRSITSGFVAIDGAGRIVRMNRAACEIFGLDGEDDARGRTVTEVFGPGTFASTLESALARGESLVRQEHSIERDGASVPIGLTSVMLANDRQERIGAILIVADLTEVRALETRVREMQSLADLGEMSAGIAHEFRNSLATILGYLRLLRRGNADPESGERLQRAEQEASQLASAVESLLRFAGPIEPRIDTVELHQLVEPIVARLAAEHREIEFRIEGSWFSTAGDGALLGRMFENLLLNAAESIEEKGESTGRITVVADARRRTVEIADNGVGLDPAEAGRLFLPFRSGKAKGFGLGLSLSRKIAVVHGGTIELEGKRGEGATIRVTLAGALS